MLQALISIPESRRLSLEAKLRHINARKIEEREYRVEGALRDGYDAIAQGFADSREALTEQVLTCRIPVVLFEIGLELGWLTRETAEQSSFYWSGPFDYRNPPQIEAPTASLGGHTVQEAFKAWFLAVLAGRIESWRGFALTQEGLDDGSAQLANPPNQSADPARLPELPDVAGAAGALEINEGAMPGLPTLLDRILRLHRLRWGDLIEKRGFTGDHLKWHQSPERRHTIRFAKWVPNSEGWPGCFRSPRASGCLSITDLARTSKCA